MPAFRNRLKRLERAFVGSRTYTDDQWDGILLLLLSQPLPEQMVAMVRTAPIYPWAEQWYAKRVEERRHWSDEQLKAAANRPMSEHFWNGVCHRFVKAWQRQIPRVPCPLEVVNGELRAVESAVFSSR
jgi:hypothetical protein